MVFKEIAVFFDWINTMYLKLMNFEFIMSTFYVKIFFVVWKNNFWIML
jgi:hypothetical protein